MSLDAQPKKGQARVLLSGYISTFIEYYDFYIYNIAAGLVFTQIFFPGESAFFGLAAALGTNAVAYVCRPLGGLIFGLIGDRVGRKTTLIITLVGMGIVTGIIGLLPDYHAIGITASVLLIVLRLSQGLFVGGEWGGAITLVLENAPKNRKTLYTGFAQMGSPTGLLLASSTFLLLAPLAEESMQAWGWRIPFLMGFVLIVVGIFVRLKLEETPEFAAAMKEDAERRKAAAADENRAGSDPETTGSGLKELFRHYWREALLGFLLTLSPSAFWLVNTFLVGYLTQDGEDYTTAQISSIPAIVGLSQVVLVIPIALMYDRFDIRKGFMIGGVLSAIAGFPVFYMADAGVSYALLVVMLVLLGGVTNLLHVGFGALLPTQFPVRLRFTGSALCYNVGMAVSGGIVPAAAAIGVAMFSGSIFGAAVGAAFFPLMGAVAAFLIKNTVNER